MGLGLVVRLGAVAPRAVVGPSLFHTLLLTQLGMDDVRERNEAVRVVLWLGTSMTVVVVVAWRRGIVLSSLLVMVGGEG